MFKRILYRVRLRRAKKAFQKLRGDIDNLNLPKFQRREIFKSLLRAAGFCHLRMREKKG